MAALSFGKYKDTPIEDVEESYLTWCLTKMERLYPQTRTMIEEELARRKSEDRAPRPTAPSGPDAGAQTCASCGTSTRGRKVVHVECASSDAVPF